MDRGVMLGVKVVTRRHWRSNPLVGAQRLQGLEVRGGRALAAGLRPNRKQK